MVVFGCRHAEKGVVCWRVGSLVRVGGLLLCAGLAAVVCCWWACVAVEWCVVLLVAGLVVVCLVLKAPVPLHPFGGGFGGRGLQFVWLVAVSCSPTPWRVQYHRRW